MVAQGQITSGTLVAFLSYMGGLFAPVQGLTGTYRTLRTALVSIDQVFKILDTPDYIGDSPDAICPQPLDDPFRARARRRTLRWPPAPSSPRQATPKCPGFRPGS